MKIRTDFVTNSSTSCYVIIGTSDESIIKKIFEQEGRDPYENVVCKEGDVIERVRMSWADSEFPNYIGLDGTAYLENKDMRISEIRKLFSDLLKSNFNIDFPIDKVHLIVDAEYNG